MRDTAAEDIREREAFRPAWWLPGPHAQTIWPTVMRRVPLRVERQRLELPDGDFIDVDWVVRDSDGPERALVFVMPGLQGSIDSPPVRGLLRALSQRGFRAGVMHFRGASGEPNRLTRGYHAGDYHDAAHLVADLQDQHPDTPVAAVGLSLGGNALLKWLGETGDDNPLDAAVAVSVPFDLHACADRLERGLSRLYQRYLLVNLRAAVRDKLTKFDTVPAELRANPSEFATLRTFRAFDDAVTAPLHGFAGVDDYYTRCSCGQYLGGIAKQTLIIHASDDPFMTPDVVPAPEAVSNAVELDIHRRGGHVGFVTGSPWRPRYWLDERVAAWLAGRLPRRA